MHDGLVGIVGEDVISCVFWETALVQNSEVASVGGVGEWCGFATVVETRPIKKPRHPFLFHAEFVAALYGRAARPVKLRYVASG